MNLGLLCIIVYLLYLNKGKVNVKDINKFLDKIAKKFKVNSPAVEQVQAPVAGPQEDIDGPVEQSNQSTHRQPSSTESDGNTETTFIHRSVSTANGSCRSYKRHPGYELLKMSVDEVFVGKKYCSSLKAKLKESCM